MGIEEVPQEVIVVEGRDDTARLVATYGPLVKTIETNGSAVSRKVLQQIQRAAHTHGIIVLTDPDYQGERIRRIVTESVPTAKQAYITPEAAFGGVGRSLGVEHARPDEIRRAIEHVATPTVKEQLVPIISVADLVKLDLIGGARATVRRQRVAEHFNLGHLNGKQLQRRLQRYGVTLAALTQFIETEEGI